MDQWIGAPKRNFDGRATKKTALVDIVSWDSYINKLAATDITGTNLSL